MTHPESTVRSIPLSRLELAPENVRKTPADPAAFEELKASIAAHGLLENLIVRIEDTGHDPGSGPEQAHVDRCAVVAGGRRLAAMKALAEEGILDADHPVPCRVIGAAENPGELSLAENVVRVAMHPADQVVAFLRLSEAGVTVAAIAARFGVTERLVEQRLSLGGVAPELLDAYRAQEMDLDTLKAFTVTIDHARQRAVWEQVKEQGYGPSGWQVKRMLTEESVPAASAVARFVGMEAYEAAGGTLTRDLFAGEDGSGTWFDDPVLLNELATEKLRAAADDLTTRWKWAEAMVEADWSALAGFGRICPEPGLPTEEEKAERESLRARQDELAYLDDDEWTEELACEAEGIESRLRTIEEAVEARAAFREQDFTIAGCIATVGHDGKLKVVEGLVRPEDMPERTGAGEGDGTDPGRVDASAITEPLAAPPDPRAKVREETGIGIGLADDLRAVRTTLVKAHLSRDFEAAFDLTLFQISRAVFKVGYRADALDIAVRETADRPPAQMNNEDFAAWSPGEGMLAERTGLSLDWMKDEDDAAAFTKMRALPEEEKQALFAAAVARTLKGQLAFEPGARPELETTIARLDIDFAKHVRPGAAMFWSRIRKDRILAVGRATLGPVWASARAKYKKADLARAMEEAFAADAPAGLNPKARAAALAWSPPGFAPFDTGRTEEAGEDGSPAGEPEPDSATAPDAVDDETPDAACGDTPARGDLARAVDALNAVPTADGGPRVIVQEIGPVNGHDSGEGIDIPEFLRGD